MVKPPSYEDIFFGGKKKRVSFIKNSQKQIKKNTLYYLQDFGRSNWIKPIEIFDKTLLKTDIFKDESGQKWFLLQGAKGQIHNATHSLRVDGYPIISGKGGRGYRYADENADGFIDIWDEASSSWHARKSNLEKERERMKKMIDKIIERLKEKQREEEAKQMQEIVIKYYQPAGSDE